MHKWKNNKHSNTNQKVRNGTTLFLFEILIMLNETKIKITTRSGDN